MAPFRRVYLLFQFDIGVQIHYGVIVHKTYSCPSRIAITELVHAVLQKIHRGAVAAMCGETRL